MAVTLATALTFGSFAFTRAENGLRSRSRMICRWIRDPASGELVCRWVRDPAREDPAQPISRF